MSPSAPILEDLAVSPPPYGNEPSSGAQSPFASEPPSSHRLAEHESSSASRSIDTPQAAVPQPACEAAACTFARTEAGEPVLPGAQHRWAARPLVERLQVIRQARHWMAAHPELFCSALSPALARAEADTLVTEFLPLLAAMRFLERHAMKLLAPRKLGSAGRPVWLAGIRSEVHHEPLGHVLVIGPANFPLFLPGVQAVQALVAGNAVTWKPGTGGQRVAALLAHVLRESGLPRGVLCITEDTLEASRAALAQHPDKVVFTGSFEAGSHILGSLAGTATPATMELSGADAVVVLPSADLSVVVKALGFGLRLNGGEVCMSPRRLVATRKTLETLRPLLQAELGRIAATPLKPQTARKLLPLLQDALQSGAEHLPLQPSPPASPQELSDLLASGKPVLLDHVTPEMAIARADIFAPVLSLIEAPSVLHVADLVNNNPYGLTAAIFGSPAEAETLATQLRVGTVLINDVIAPTADPRIPFGGRGHSGYGVTRGAEGLLEMTATKTILRRRRLTTLHYDPLGAGDLPLFAALAGALYGGSLRTRWQAFLRVVAAGKERATRAKQAQMTQAGETLQKSA